MVLDIAIAMFAKNHQMQGDAPRPVPSFKRARTNITPLSRTTPLDKIAKHMRYTAFKRHEQRTKQVQMLINQRKFAQNETWRAEYDRLRGSNIMGVDEQQRIDARIDDLLKMGLQVK